MRFVIKGKDGGHFTEFSVVKTRAVTLNGVIVGHESDMRPLFEAYHTRHATKFDTEADAYGQIANQNPLLGGPEAFEGCTVQPTED